MASISAAERFDGDVRLFVFRRTAEVGTVPVPSEIATALDRPLEAVEESLRRLAAGRVLVLAPGTTNIWMANPFSAVPTDFRVNAGGRSYFGNCIWDALGIPAILHADGVVATGCANCGEPMALEIRRGALARSEGLIHFGVPASQWWVNIGFT